METWVQGFEVLKRKYFPAVQEMDVEEGLNYMCMKLARK